MKLNRFIVVKWNSLFLAVSSIIVSAVLLYFTHKFAIPSLMLFSGVVKLIGISLDNNHLRLIGLIGLNVCWGLLGSWFLLSVEYSNIYASLCSLIILGFGVGISIQERFYEQQC